jgi:hypothetical protein
MTIEPQTSAPAEAGRTQSSAAEISWWGVRTMAEHEFRLRIRAGRWRWLLAAWFFTLLLLTWGLRAALVASGAEEPGVDMFGGLMLFMLALAMLVVPRSPRSRSTATGNAGSSRRYRSRCSHRPRSLSASWSPPG